MADFQARGILSLFYFIVVLPFGLLLRAFADPMAIRRRGGTNWMDFVDRAGTLDEARRQF